MGEPKAFASLSSGLLARKGAARPAMRPQGFGQNGSGLEDLGWNDMGFEPPKPAETDDLDDCSGAEIENHPTRTCADALTPFGSPVQDQLADLEGKLSECDENGEEYDDTAEEYEPTEDELAALKASAESDPSERAGNVSRDEESFDEEDDAVSFAASAPVTVPVAAVPKPFENRRSPRARSEPGSKAKAAFTLRLDKDRHLKLRLACAVRGVSAQKLVTEALDALLDGMPEIDEMAGK